MPQLPIRVTVWNENVQDSSPEVRACYPEGIHGALSAFLGEQPDFSVRVATLDMPEHGFSEEAARETDVLLWWGHLAHQQVSAEVVERVCRRVNRGMGLIVLHSAHASQVFKRLMGTETDRLRWRENDERSRLWAVAPGHPILEGVPDTFVIERDETYGEPFGIPEPERTILISWSPGGEVFRAGCCFARGAGRIFYFQPGHETLPVYYDPNVQRVITNAVRWAAPVRQGELLLDLGTPNGAGLEG